MIFAAPQALGRLGQWVPGKIRGADVGTQFRLEHVLVAHALGEAGGLGLNIVVVQHPRHRAASATRCRVTTTSKHNLTAYLDGAGLRGDPKGPLIGRGTARFTHTVLPQANAYAMIGRRAAAAGIATKLGNHSFRATGITAYLKNGGTLEKAAAMANHASTRTTQLYDRRHDEVSLDEVERIVI